ncbi:FMN-dependent NADH-azoreductase 2 [Chlamydia abortus]|uniref:FMN dependent NADH:quinone oxidoreductase n=1 Tax=Paenibacillus residui TaxID=629724 RepID=A0ABW3DFE5_9BACL|nr:MULTISPECIES: FMN-dependent NADH-azoreductase [Paenibacillaceae]SHE13287.1 FMN-dependent NADH-azoreductase 2 [Chlamydia abortus]
MSTVLFVKANNRPAEQAVSVKLYDSFLQSYRQSHPEDEIIELDLFAENLPYYDATMINAMFKSRSGMELSPEEKKAADLVQKYLDQFLRADKVVFAFPLWNKTVPAPLHTYIDYLNQAGQTFRYTPEGPVGLVTGRKAAILNARGGIYSEGPAAAHEMAVNFVTMNLQQFGFTDFTTVIVEGHNQFPDKAADLIQKGIEQSAQAAQSF